MRAQGGRAMSERKPILVLDFDGVMHSYVSGWQGIEPCNDPPVPGLDALLEGAWRSFEVHVDGSRASEDDGLAAMIDWCEHWLGDARTKQLRFPVFKPPAMVTLDDRALTFTGTWPDVET